MVADFTRSQRAEDICGFVWLAVAAYDKAEVASRAVDNWRRDDELDRAVLSAISEIVSHAEVFVAEALVEHAKALSSGLADPIPKILIETITTPVEDNWAGKRKFISTWFGEHLGGTTWWRRWMGFVDARNAWAHGLGRLTMRQLKNQDAMANLKAAGLSVSASRVVGTADDVRWCAKSAVAVIDWVDQRVVRT